MLRGLVFLALLVCSFSAHAQQYPASPVRVLVGFAAGSGPDLQARTIAQQLATDLKQSFFIENRLGANGTIAARAVAQAAPDGLTLAVLLVLDRADAAHLQEPRLRHADGSPPGRDLRHSRRHAGAGRCEIADQEHRRSDRRGESGPRAVRLARRRQPPASRARGVRAEGRHHLAARALQGLVGGGDGAPGRQRAADVRDAGVGDRPGQGRPDAGARLHRDQAVSGIPRRAAAEGPRAGLPADGLVGHVLRARQDAGRDRRQAQRRRPRRAEGAGRRRRHAARRLYPGQPRRRRRPPRSSARRSRRWARR